MRKFISILFALVLVLSFSLIPAVPAGAQDSATLHVSKWTEDVANPIFDPVAKAYYPTVVKVSDSDYRMWYGSDTGVGYAISPDGLGWTEEVNPVSGLTNANHPLVEYYVDGFSGANSGNNPSSDTMYYRIWYWPGLSYSITDIRYAESADGETWFNDQAITGNIITTGDVWNRGSYGPIDVLYNSTATNTGDNPFDYSFAMYFDGTTGAFEEIGLGYSPDGIDWELYGKVLPRGNNGVWGNTDDWDSSYATFGTIIKEADGKWHMWYSGGIVDSNDGIGYAHSSDGLHWVRSPNNPIMHQNDGVPWRAERTYCPMVIEDGGIYKMWFSGKNADGNYAIGYATNPNPDAAYTSIQSAIDAANPGDAISVAAGEYDEDVTVDKDLILNGAQVDEDARDRTEDESHLTGSIKVTSSNVTIDGFKITGTGAGPLAGVCMRIESASATVKNNIIEAVEATGGYTYSGFVDLDGITNALIEQNYIYGAYEADRAPNVIRLGITGAGEVAVVNNELDEVGGGGGVGITCGNAGAVINVIGNEMNHTGDGVWVWNGGGSNFDTLSITDNEIHHCNGTHGGNIDTGIKLVGTVTGTVVVSGNDFQDNSIQVDNTAEVLDIQGVLDTNTFDRAVVVDHTGGSLLHTIWSKIQDGIDAAVSGDTVNVAAGKYDERITIEKPLTLRGATSDVNKNGYEVPADYAWDDTVESIINNPEPAPTGLVSVVHIQDTNNVTFEGSVVQSLNAPQGSGNDMLVTIKAETQTMDNIIVRNNVIGPNTNVEEGQQDGTAGRMGLYISVNQYQESPYGLTNSTIAGNKIFGCEGNGNNVFIWGAYYSYGARNPSPMGGTVIEDNEIYGSHRSGIETAGGYTGLTIQNNKIYGNSGLPTDDPEKLKYGHGMVLIRGSSDSGEELGLGPENLTITGNEIYNNEKSGIYMGPVNKNYTITGNKIYDNGWDGIRLDMEAHYKNPNFEPEDRIGFFDHSEDIAAQFNNIYSNSEYGIRVIGTPTNGFVLDATNNWWGTKAKGLIKNMVRGSVDYDPWIGAKAKDSKSKKTAEGDDTVSAKDKTDTDVVKKGKGKPTITVTEYTDNPGDGAPGGFSSAGKYIDVHIDDPEDVEEIEIRNYYTADDIAIAGLDEATLRLSWWNVTLSLWVECSDSGVNTADTDGYSGYVWAKIRETGTIPTLADMTGTAFMSMGKPPAPAPAPAPPPVGGGGGGGGGGAPPVTVSPVGSIGLSPYLDWEGKTTIEIRLSSADGLVTVVIPLGILVLDAEGNPLGSMETTILAAPPPAPEDCNVIGLVYDFGPDGATFEPGTTMIFTYDPADIPDGVSEEDLVVAYWDGDKWVILPTTVDTAANTATAGVAHFTMYAILAKVSPTPAAFAVSSLEISPGQATIGETVTTTIKVANTGGTKGSCSLELKIDGIVKAVKEITLDPNQSQIVSFELTDLSLGAHQVEVSDLTAELSIVPLPPTPPLAPAAEPFTYGWLIAIISALAVIAALAFIMARKRLQPVTATGEPAQAVPGLPSRVTKAFLAVATVAASAFTTVRERLQRAPGLERGWFEKPAKPFTTAGRRLRRAPLVEEPAEVAPSTLRIYNLRISPNRVKPGELITVFAEAANDGYITRSCSLVLKIKGIAEAVKEITLSPGQSQKVAFMILKDKPGVYDVDLEDLKGSFTVED